MQPGELQPRHMTCPAAPAAWKRRFRAYSAGSQPTGRLNPHVRGLLERLDFPTATLRSKSWDEFAQPEAPHTDSIFTVCDSAAGEVCPVWPGQPAVMLSVVKIVKATKPWYEGRAGA